ncbi:MAG: threonine ammonia-lyase, biosynthetic [Rhodospirillaceae bacterium]|nr:threonine ammonia-lyase, biosynthetic [Rhodospirillaceae bacterium]MBT3628084.1 threonine ammonia-lyase, biosynthetic [Rhodospirillaceae bacterium]MBT5780191.1 threonine ammonia-lyase, biosynthetic [Rhodospirillaceae bacterium]
MPERYIKKILNARVYDVAVETPLESAALLTARLGNRVLLKREDLQPCFSFKLRGAYNKISGLTPSQAAPGVIAASAGNHAQGVALSAHKLGIKAQVVMPQTTPEIKVNAVQRWGARTILHGDTYDEAEARALALAQDRGLTYIHPYDDGEVIAGQGTIAMEILRQHSGPLHAVFVPVGGGGLIAGIAAYIKTLRPEVKIIGVEPEDAASLHTALRRGRRVRLDHVGIFADGVAVRQIGKEPFRLARKLVDEVVLASVDEICAAIKDIYDDTRSIAEPAGALAVAGLKKYVQRDGLKNRSLVAIDSGANVNFDRLRHVAERAELGERREAVFAVTIPEQPGSFRAFCRALGKRQVTEFNYRYGDSQEARIFVGVQTSGAEERETLFAQLASKGYDVADLSDNDAAKLHVRYMIGGHATAIENELLYRFEFPERPGALLNFLNHMKADWNISLFHYRNHGAAYGRVLCGMQVAKRKRADFQSFLDGLGYNYRKETDNPAYRLFLG